MDDNPETMRLIQSIGSLAETSYIFYDALIRNGIDEATAGMLTRQYIAATLYGSGNNKRKMRTKPKEEEPKDE